MKIDLQQLNNPYKDSPLLGARIVTLVSIFGLIALGLIDASHSSGKLPSLTPFVLISVIGLSICFFLLWVEKIKYTVSYILLLLLFVIFILAVR